MYANLPVLSDLLTLDLGDYGVFNSSALIYPVHQAFEQDGSPFVAGHLVAYFTWDEHLKNVSSVTGAFNHRNLTFLRFGPNTDST